MANDELPNGPRGADNAGRNSGSSLLPGNTARISSTVIPSFSPLITGASDLASVQLVLSCTDEVVDGVDDVSIAWLPGTWAGELADAWLPGSWAVELADLDAEQAIETATKMIKDSATCGSALVMSDFIAVRDSPKDRQNT